MLTTQCVALLSWHSGAERSLTNLNVGFVKGYNTGVVDADEHCDTPHDAGPLPLEFVWLSQVAVQAGVQEAHHGCGKKNEDEVNFSDSY